jgi:ABC-2 type transport system ATP-binding protein
MTHNSGAALNRPAIEARNLRREFGKTAALADVSFAVPQGAVYALVGANGAGKSTLIQVLMNMLESTGGAAWMLGEPVTELFGTRLNRLGYISEEQKWPEWMTIGGFLAYLRPFYPQWDRELEQRLLQQFDLPLNRKLKHLSRGMRMKVAFVGTLAYRPAVILLDEPLSGLDPLVRDELIDSLQGLQREGAGFTAFLSTHDLGEIEGFATHVGFLERGRVLFSEEMGYLKGRFRKVTFQVDESVVLTNTIPHTWMQQEITGSKVTFVHSAYREEGIEHEVVSVYASAREIAVESLPLRAIFLATAKAGRIASPQSEILGAEGA